MVRVCHISPVHDVVDNRIFLKQCCSLRDAGFDVYWVVQNPADEVKNGINVVALKEPASLLTRWLFTGWQAFRRAVKTNAKVFHFHDPEFIPYALLLRLTGRKVIYDIHEDYVSSVSQKSYIPAPLRWLISRVAGFAEKLSTCFFERVIAERYYEDRFPAALKVLNYPRIPDGEAVACGRSTDVLLYTGKVHIYRGAMIYTRIPELVSNVSVMLLGRCSSELQRKMVDSSKSPERLTFTGIDEFVPFTEINRQYREGSWLAGLAVFPPNEHLDRKELTKLFEYMQYGLPIIASNFPVWQRLVADNGCGICVDPENEDEIKQAIERLRDDSDFWNECSKNGMRTVREKYSWASQEAALLKLYEKLVKQ